MFLLLTFYFYAESASPSAKTAKCSFYANSCSLSKGILCIYKKNKLFHHFSHLWRIWAKCHEIH